jgi:hypothetical protein
MVSGIKQRMAEAGIEPSDFPKALIAHEVMGITLLFGAWGLCYALRPSRTFGGALFSAFPALRNTTGPKALEAATVNAEAFLQRQKWLKRIPGLRSADTTRLVVGLAESSIARKVLLPVTVPVKMWLSYKVVMAGK